MDFFSTLGDDEIALLGCVGALLVCGTLMSVSYFIGQKLNPATTVDEQEDAIPADGHTEQTDQKATRKAA